MKQISLLLFALLFSAISYSQDLNQQATDYFNQAKQYLNNKQYTEAIDAYKQSANLFLKAGNIEAYKIAGINELDLLIKSGAMDQAIPLADSLYKYISIDTNVSAPVAYFYSLYGRIKYIHNEFDEAKKFYNIALNMNNKIEPNSRKNAFIYSDLSLVYKTQNILDSALIFVNKSISTIKQNEGDNSPNLVYPLINLSNIYILLGDYDKAIETKKKIKDISLKAFGENSEETAEAYAGLGQIYLEIAEYNLSKEYLLKALNIFKTIFGENSYKIVPIYMNLGNLYNKLGNYDFSLQYYFLATKLIEANNQQAGNLPQLYNNIGMVCKNQNNLTTAETYFKKAYDISLKMGMQNTLQTTVIMTNLGNIYKMDGKTQLAKQIFKKDLEISEKLFGQHNPNNVLSYLNLAQIYIDENDIDSAQFFLLKSINANYKTRSYNSINQELVLDDYSNGLYLLESIKNIIFTYQYLYKKDSSSNYLLKATYFINKADTLVTNLRRSFLNEKDKIKVNSQLAEVIDYAIQIYHWMYLFNIIDKKQAIDKMFYYIERNKSSTLLEALNQNKIQLFADVPDSLIQKENNLRKKIIYLNQKLAEAVTTNEQAYYREQYIKVQDEFSKLTLFYKKNYPSYYNAKFDINITDPETIQFQLNDTSAIVEYAIVTNEIIAVIITKDTSLIFSSTFSSKNKIDIKKLNSSILSNTPVDVKKYLNYSFTVFKNIFPSNIPDGIKRLIIVPDDILSTVSFESLLSEPVKYSNDIDFKTLPYLIKKYNISYTYSATIFNEITKTQYFYDQSSKTILSVAPVFKPNNPQSYDGNPVKTIIGSEQEVKNIAEICHQYNLRFDTLLNNNANEYKFKKMIKSTNYQIIHIATHGIINFKTSTLSALIFSKDPKNIEDGILYTGEIYNLKLNSQLVTLSACETARGVISKGEGVIGLSRAFTYAGAQNLIISLWKVSDIATTQEMTYFYSNLFEQYPEIGSNMEFSDALHKAKLQMINSKFAHPFFWSSFILIGK